MSPRNRQMLMAFALLALSLVPGLLLAGDSSKEKNPLVSFYQDHLSAADGERCPMTPSCSQYAAQAIKKHGPVLGYIMACDRIMRCGRDEAEIAPKRYINGQAFISDPVEANDFWWFASPDQPGGPE